MEDQFITFLKKNDYPISQLRDFFTCDQYQEALPERGAYILLAGDGTKWKYPKGESSVFYIGQSCDLPRRLVKEHLKLAKQAREGSRRYYEYYSAKYEFAAAFNAKFILVNTWQNMPVEKLEGWVLYDFTIEFGSLPLTNSKADNCVWEMLEQ